MAALGTQPQDLSPPVLHTGNVGIIAGVGGGEGCERTSLPTTSFLPETAPVPFLLLLSGCLPPLTVTAITTTVTPLTITVVGLLLHIYDTLPA